MCNFFYFYKKYARKQVVFWINLHSWHKFYTTAGRDRRDKSQLCLFTTHDRQTEKRQPIPTDKQTIDNLDRQLHNQASREPRRRTKNRASQKSLRVVDINRVFLWMNNFTRDQTTRTPQYYFNSEPLMVSFAHL